MFRSPQIWPGMNKQSLPCCVSDLTWTNCRSILSHSLLAWTRSRHDSKSIRIHEKALKSLEKQISTSKRISTAPLDRSSAYKCLAGVPVFRYEDVLDLVNVLNNIYIKITINLNIIVSALLVKKHVIGEPLCIQHLQFLKSFSLSTYTYERRYVTNSL